MTIETTWLSLPINHNEIIDAAIAGVDKRFAEIKNHKPSEEHKKGLQQIAKVIEAMACRMHEHPDLQKVYPEFGRSFFVSFLPPGMGKTTTLIQSIKAISGMSAYDHVGFIIFLERYEEIEKVVAEMGLSEEDYAVTTSDQRMNAKGNQNKKSARVLFTTQAMLRSKADNGQVKFEDMADFYYQGKPRQVRVWDEAVLPFMALTVERKKVMKLVDGLSRINRDLSNDIDQLQNTLAQKQDGDRITLPDIKKYDIALDELRVRFFDDEDKNNIEALYGLSGREARISKDQYGTTTIQYVDTLPDDLAPMLILDASGQQRKTYEYWYKERKGLKFLYSPQKTYEGLTIHHWNEGAGKQTQGKGKYKLIAEGVAKSIVESVPASEDVLVIHYKKSGFMPDMQAEIEKILRSDPKFLRQGKVHYRHWGTHTATNDYSHIKHVILAGILQYNTAQYEAYGLGAKGQDVHKPLTEEEFEEVRLGEIAHHILQASCRGYVRNSEGEKCPDGCHLYVVFSTHKGTGTPQSLLTTVFPKAVVREWRPVFKVSKRMIGVCDYLCARAKGKAVILAKSKVAEDLNMHPNNLSYSILKHPDFLPYMKSRGMEVKDSHGKIEIIPEVLFY